MPERIKFILTENLNRLAKWLRLLGYDAALYKAISFPNLIRLARKDKRTLLTRSSEQAGSRQHFARRLLKSENHLQQLREIKDLLVYDEELIFSRCLLCNRKLVPITREKIKSRIPEFIYRNQQLFKICRQCGRIFWQGTHTAEMLKTLTYIFQGDNGEEQ
ncbi:MAG: hypothetical protein JXB60_06905 [Candidatus Cloacimonetes bacterium]|nr:hypothetical protein [Candidatus Cloacimonadota bacterium]